LVYVKRVVVNNSLNANTLNAIWRLELKKVAQAAFFILLDEKDSRLIILQ
jgi:hypothetical protein